MIMMMAMNCHNSSGSFETLILLHKWKTVGRRANNPLTSILN